MPRFTPPIACCRRTWATSACSLCCHFPSRTLLTLPNLPLPLPGPGPALPTSPAMPTSQYMLCNHCLPVGLVCRPAAGLGAWMLSWTGPTCCHWESSSGCQWRACCTTSPPWRFSTKPHQVCVLGPSGVCVAAISAAATTVTRLLLLLHALPICFHVGNP